MPEGEREIFADPVQHSRQRDTYIIYDNYWDLFAPIEPIPMAGVLRDYETIRLAGLEVDVVPLPGVTLGQIGLSLRRDGAPIVFCAEPFIRPAVWPGSRRCKHSYNDLGGAVNAFYSARDLRRLQTQALLPSLGAPILNGCDDALAQLQVSLTALCAGRPYEASQIAAAAAPQIEQITPHVWRTTGTSEA